MPADVLKAMNAIEREKSCSLEDYGETYSIRINSVGERLEYYVKDALSGGFYRDAASRDAAYRDNYAWLGNQNNPPDAIARGGDGSLQLYMQGENCGISPQGLFYFCSTAT